MLYGIIVVIHILVSIFLILVVLLQTGKRADLAGAFGGGGSQTAFGPRGTASVLSRATTAAATAFMLTSLGLSILSSTGSGSESSAFDEVTPETTQEAPAAPSQDAGDSDPGAVPGEGSDPSDGE